MKTKDIFEALYYSLCMGDYPELFESFKQSEQAKIYYDEFTTLAGIEEDSDKEDKLIEYMGEHESEALRHGFAQGLKLGLKLAISVLCDTN